MNKELVKGDLIANAPPEKTWDDNLNEGFAAGYANYKLIMKEAKAKKDAINAKVAGYIDALDTNVDVTDLTPTQQNSITNYLVKQRSEYADAASRIAKIEDPTSPQYMELRAKINGISQSFQNLATQVKSYKEDKASYLKDFDNGLISDGNEINTLNEASKLYTNEASLGVGEGGSLVFWNEGKETYDSYNQIPKPFLKDFEGANQLLEINKSIYNAGSTLTGARKNMIRQQLNNILIKGGRRGLLSLASDDFIMQGGLGIEDPELFAPGNDDDLRQAVLDNYMNILSDTAAQGARDKRPSSIGGSGGFSGALKDEINVSGNVADKALQFSLLAKEATGGNSVAIVNQMANIINSIDPTSTKIYVTKGQMYEKFMVGMDEEDSPELRKQFVDQFGNFNMYTTNTAKDPKEDARGVNVNTSDPRSMFEFYINNSDLSAKAKNYYIDLYGKQTSGSQNNNNNSGSGSLNNL
jgi:hypothetical protein